MDPQGIREFRDYLKVLASEGVGILISSHLLSEMQLMCDSFAVIEKGKLIHTKEHIVDEKTETINEVSFTVSDGKLAKKNPSRTVYGYYDPKKMVRRQSPYRPPENKRPI
ncbi:hypothetical protein RCO48_20415 [Peribacillus frigoritolerans]|nr:hypothetical protein [Peribacillus frigoritolerans]